MLNTYFSSTKSIERCNCAQAFYGKTSKMLYLTGMTTVSESPDVCLDFIRQHGIPSALRHDNAKSEISEHVKQIHRDLVIANQWTEPYSPWQNPANPAELNGVKYIKLDVQEIIDKLDVMPSNLPRYSHSKQKTRKHNDDIPKRTRSKTGH
jgi:hypothetical protein